MSATRPSRIGEQRAQRQLGSLSLESDRLQAVELLHHREERVGIVLGRSTQAGSQG